MAISPAPRHSKPLKGSAAAGTKGLKLCGDRMFKSSYNGNEDLCVQYKKGKLWQIPLHCLELVSLLEGSEWSI